MMPFPSSLVCVQRAATDLRLVTHIRDHNHPVVTRVRQCLHTERACLVVIVLALAALALEALDGVGLVQGEGENAGRG